MRVTQREPAKAREEPAPPPFDEQPGARNPHQPAQGASLRQEPRDEPAKQRVIGAHDGHETQHEKQREHERRVPDLLDGDIQPVRTHGERAGVEPESEYGRAARARAFPEPDEYGRHEDGHGPPAERRERQREQHAGHERSHAADETAPDDFAGIHSFSSGRSSGGTMSRGAVSRRESIRRRSKRMTLSSQSAS